MCFNAAFKMHLVCAFIGVPCFLSWISLNKLILNSQHQFQYCNFKNVTGGVEIKISNILQE